MLRNEHSVDLTSKPYVVKVGRHMHLHLISVLVLASEDQAETGLNSRVWKLIKAFVRQVEDTYETARYLRSSVLKS